MNKITNWMLTFFASLLVAICWQGNAMASSCLSTNATFSGSIGSQTTCSDHNMLGVIVGSGETGGNPGGVYWGQTCDFMVTTAVPIGDEDPTTFTITAPPGSMKPTCQIKMAISQGNQGANYCQNIYPFGISSDTLTTLNDKGTDTVNHKQLEVCTDEITTGAPRVQLEKRVTLVGVDGNGDPTYDCATSTKEIDVISPAQVAYCYVITNIGLGNIDDLVLVDDLGVPGSVNPVTTLSTTSLGPGESATADLLVMLDEEGVVTNVATVEGTFEGVVCEDCTDTDSALVNVVVTCDQATQDQADLAGQVIETRGQEGIKRCGPKSAQTATSVALLCDDSCTLKEDCKADPLACKQPCKPSKNWTYIVTDEFGVESCFFAEPGNDRLPLCAEVLSNPANIQDETCSAIKNPAFFRSDGHSNTYGRNPTILHFPSSGGGDSTGTIYCILDPDEDPSVCPDGAFVF